MKRSRFSVLVGSVCIMIALVLVFMPVSGNAQSKKVIELKFASNYNPVHPPGKACLWFADQINKRSNGRVHVVVYPAGTLTAPPSVYDAVVTGIADIGIHTINYTPGRFVAIEVGNIPYQFNNGWVSTHNISAFANHFMPKEVQDTHFFFAASPGPYAFFACTRTPPIRTPKDIKGLKVRCSGPVQMNIVKAYGGSPINITMNETAQAASKGVIDAIIAPGETLKGFNFADVTSSITIPGQRFCTSGIAVMNLKKWNSLPQDIQYLFNEVSLDAVNAFGKMWYAADTIGYNHFLERGGKLIDIPSEDAQLWADPIKTIVDDYIKRANEAGLPGADYVEYLQTGGLDWNRRVPLDGNTALAWFEKEMKPLVR